MDSISRYHLGQHEDGLWHVIDSTTGGPAEVEVDGRWELLYRLPKWEAEEWCQGLNEQAGIISRKNPSR